jgi:hypothetical protein
MAARLWNARASTGLTILGVLASLLIIVACASSTPLLGLAIGLLAAFTFPIRRHLAWVRWGIAGILLALHLVMEKPVWHLFARVNVFGGSTGWHRYNLLDQFIRRFDEWWLVGTDYTGHWGYHLVDVTNVYVAQGIRAGFLNLVLYIAMLTVAFRRVGIVSRSASSRAQLAYSWGLGIALFSNCVVQTAVSFFGEILFALYAILAAISSMPKATVSASAKGRVANPRRARELPATVEPGVSPPPAMRSPD